MDGGWDVHRGSGPDGRLVQPGDNIILAIDRPGLYRIRLDLKSDTWDLSFVTGSTAWNLSARSSDVVTPAVPWRWDWFEPVNDAERRKFYGGGAIWDRQYGGDIRGIMESLDYLED